MTPFYCLSIPYVALYFDVEVLKYKTIEYNDTLYLLSRKDFLGGKVLVPTVNNVCTFTTYNDKCLFEFISKNISRNSCFILPELGHNCAIIRKYDTESIGIAL